VTKFALLVLAAISVSACGHKSDPKILYRSIDNRMVLIANKDKYYLGTADIPESSDFLEKYGIEIRHFNNCRVIGNFAILNYNERSGTCDGINVRPSALSLKNNTQLFDSTCASFRDGNCHLEAEDSAPFTVSYERNQLGKVSSIYIAGLSQRDPTSTLRLESTDSF